MQLIYRGVPYKSNTLKLEMVDAGITARYRGASYSLHSPQLPQEGTSSLTLKYRGVAYSGH
ncbi:MAG: DUF4278 domain-containing protein [Leptolyngbyaceae cyanobacterium MO_188.B28]|nr:DUF4278 domain-containing protein [Leptolyngbyaceae cyanobacterium MO_188.B28]